MLGIAVATHNQLALGHRLGDRPTRSGQWEIKGGKKRRTKAGQEQRGGAIASRKLMLRHSFGPYEIGLNGSNDDRRNVRR